MVALGQLWLPIVLSAVIVFIVQALVHMVLKYHNAEWTKVPDSDALQEAIRKQGMGPGQYMFPHADPKEMKNPEVVKKYEDGPVGVLYLVKPGRPAMGKMMVLMLVFNLVVSFFAAYLASRTLHQGDAYLAVFRVVGTVAFMAYGFQIVPEAIWYGRKWSDAWKTLFDALLYGLFTAGTFGWLWPR